MRKITQAGKQQGKAKSGMPHFAHISMKEVVKSFCTDPPDEEAAEEQRNIHGSVWGCLGSLDPEVAPISWRSAGGSLLLQQQEFCEVVDISTTIIWAFLECPCLELQ